MPAAADQPVTARYAPPPPPEQARAPQPTRSGNIGEDDWTNPEANPEHEPIRKVLPVGKLGNVWPPPEEAPPEKDVQIVKTKVASDEEWKKEELAESLYTAAPWGGALKKAGKQWPPPEPETILVPYKSPVIDQPVENFRQRPPEGYQYQNEPSNTAAFPAFQGQADQARPVAPQVPLPFSKRQQQQ